MKSKNFIKTSIHEYLNEQNEILLAPNGKRSRLHPKLYKLVRTDEFKAWFGDWINDSDNSSKVVDNNGEPLVVYHGTTKNFNIFEIVDRIKPDWKIREYGVYFSDSYSTAKEYSFEKPEENVEYVEWCEKLDKLKAEQDWNGWEKLYLYGKDIYKPTPKIINTKSIKVMECFLNIRKPHIKNGNGKHWFNMFKNIVDIALDNNNDGIICTNVIEVYDDVQNTYVAFKPNQIKLADGTNTSFNSETDDIRF